MWKQGEHVCVIGDTGSGKTYLIERLVSLRGYVIVLRTKPDDNPFTGFKKIRSVREISVNHDRYVLEPAYEKQRIECARALDLVWRQGHWCVVVDELYYLIQDLKLEKFVNRLLTQGRSKGISVVNGMQRPVGISRYAISQSVHTICFQCERRDTKLLAEATTDKIIEPALNLERYQCVVFNRRTKSLTVTDADHITEVI